MELGRILGRVVCSVKVRGLEGVKLLVLQPVDTRDQPQGAPLVCADALQAGPGDLVQWVKGREACHSLPVDFVPVDAAVVGIVDHAWSDPAAYNPQPDRR